MKEFIFTPGIWLGEGKISFSASPEFIKFYMKWEITEEAPLFMKARQMIQMQGIEEKTVNDYIFTDIHADSFRVILENEALGKAEGQGIVDEKIIAWEFIKPSTFVGFETYERKDNGDFFLHAEFGTNDHYRTIIEGLVWPKQP